MRIAKLTMNNWKYLLVFVVLTTIALGFLVGKDLYPTRLDSQSQVPLVILEAQEPCDSSNVYTSLPPKCKTLDGEFVPVPGSAILVTPEGK